MKLILMKMSVSIYTCILFMKTPMSLGILLITQTFISTMILVKISQTSWMPMIMFLMFIGGILILFMYMSSIASNEKFSFNMILIIIPLILLMIPLEEMMTEMQNSDFMFEYKINESISMTKIYNKKSMYITVLLFMYMFLTMIAVTDIIKIFKGPLRSFK